MIAFVLEAGSGWVAVLFIALTSSLPFLMRRARVPGLARLRGLNLHYTLGFAIPALATLHASFKMVRLRGVGAAGIWLATVALIALCLQMTIGIRLRDMPRRAPMRRWHLCTMLVASGLIAGHIVLNRA